jgi:iron complex outermembrane recepter protein
VTNEKSLRKLGILMVCALVTPMAFSQSNGQSSGNDDSLLEEVVITADRVDSFAADFVQAGTFRGAELIDTPLTVNVLTRELLDSQQATQLYDALKNTAGVTSAQLNNALYSNMAIRGIVVENRGNYRLNGALPIVNLIDLPMENKDRVEVLKGVSALYYGFTTPSGIVNLTSKRPPNELVFDATLFGNRFGTLGGHIDYGKKFADGKFGLRFNALMANLDIGVDNTSGDRSFVSIATDWRPTEKFKIELDLERIDKTYSEPTTYFVPMGAPILPPLPDPERNLGGDWMQGDGYENNALLSARWRFARDWELSVSGGRSELSRNRYFSQFQFTNAAAVATGAGNVTVTLTNGNVNENENYRTELAGAFLTGPFKHEVTIGYTSNERIAEVTTNPTQSYAQNAYNPTPPAVIALPARVVRTANKIEDEGLYLFDRISYRTWLQLLVGVRQTDYESNTRTLTPTVSNVRYLADEVTPAAGLVIKPREWLSFYGTYIEGLEEGGIAGPTTVNAGEVLAPNTSEQIEFGVKAEAGSTLITLGYFDIDRASAFVNSANRFVQDGRTSYRGLEFSAAGEVNDRLSIYSTAMFLSAKQEQTQNGTQNGFRPENTPKLTASFFMEYRLSSVPGFALSGGFYHTGNRMIDQLNRAKVGGFTTFDLGARYRTDAFGNETTFRLNAENIFDKKYWSATASSLLNPNLPPTIKLSVTTRFGK